jgi:DNA polymerase-3 subunit gamma/tau
MADQAARLGPGTLTRYAEIVHLALIEMRGTTSPRLVLELLCARMMLPDAATDMAALLQRVERVERRIGAGSAAPAPSDAEAAPANPPTPAKRPARAAADRSPPAAADRSAAPRPEAAPVPATPPPAAGAPAATAPAPATPPPAAAAPVVTAPAPATATSPADAAGLDAAALRRLWPEVLDVIGASSRTIRALLETSQVVDANGTAVTVAVAGSLAKRLSEEGNVAAIAAGLTSVVGGSWRITIQPAGPGAAAAGRPEREPDPRDDADDPATAPAAPPVDPEQAAMQLLRDELGARPVEG